ncbi:MAG: PqqD family protein [Prevotella sp.]
MKTKKGFNLRQVCGENVIVAEGAENIDFSSIISMNESSAYLWNSIQGKEFGKNNLVELLTQEYEVDADTAAKDVEALVAQWMKAGIIE